MSASCTVEFEDVQAPLLQSGAEGKEIPCELDSMRERAVAGESRPASYATLLNLYFYQGMLEENMAARGQKAVGNFFLGLALLVAPACNFAGASVAGFAYLLGNSVSATCTTMATGVLIGGPLAIYILWALILLPIGAWHGWGGFTQNKKSATETPKTANGVQKYYYSVLGVHENASIQEIRKAYFRMSKKHHPDKSKNVDAASQMAIINEAHETLADPDKRDRYDKEGENTHAQGLGQFYEGFLGTPIFVEFIGHCQFADVMNLVQDSTSPEARMEACVEYLSHILDQYERCSNYEAYLATELEPLFILSNIMGRKIISKIGDAYVVAALGNGRSWNFFHRYVRTQRLLGWASSKSWKHFKKEIWSAVGWKTTRSTVDDITVDDYHESIYMIYECLSDAARDSVDTICKKVLANTTRQETRREALEKLGRYLIEKGQSTHTDGDGVKQMVKLVIDQQWPVGSKVKIHSLKRDTALNGLDAEVCQAYDSETRRIQCRVFLSAECFMMNMKINNLKSVSSDKPPSSNV
jgi:curved DNA-binding protein CbpA